MLSLLAHSPVRTRGSAHRAGLPRPLAPLSSFVLGPQQERADARGEDEALAREIRRLGGVVGPGDVMRVTGLGRAQAEARLCRLAAAYDGDVAVSEEGAVLYHFPALRPSRHAPPVRPAPAAWERRRALPPVTGNAPRVDLGIALGLLGVLVASALVMAPMGEARGWGLLALAPIALALVALALPLGRLLSRRALLRAFAREQGRGGLLRAVLERAPGVAVEAYALGHAWIAAGGRPLPRPAFFDELRALGGEPDVDDEGRLLFRFPDLDREARALGAARGVPSG